jgi:mono/diheme cytochrome c family protein
VASDRIVERRRVFQQYKADVKERGKPFYPFAMLHDTIMSLVVVGVIIGLAIVWKTTAGDTPEEPGWLGKIYDEEADPGTISFTPRPDWYFYFLFYLLRVFKWPESVVLGTVGIPTIALVLLLAIPFLDLRSERRLMRRPVAIVAAILVVISMGVLTYKGATAKEALGSELKAQVPTWAKEQGFEDNKEAVAGATLFAEAGCLNCHTYLGDGGRNLGAPDLTEEGAKGKGMQFQIEHLKCPSCVNKGSPMPSFAALGEERLKQLATFLEASKGQKKDVGLKGTESE